MAFIIGKCAFMKNSMHVARTISYLERQSALFSDSGELNFEQAYQSYIDASPPRVWHHIISLSAEDAQRLNVDREYMKQLLCVEQSRIAEAYNTVPSNMRIVASWHEKDHHPHLHLLFYSTDRREGGVWAHTDQEAKVKLNDASEKVKSLFANRIFTDDLAPLKEIKNMRRAELNQQVKQSIRAIAQHDPSDEVVKALEHLSHSLSGLKGKLHYEYLPPHIKSEVDDLLRIVIDTEPTCRSLQEQYAQSCRDLILTYARKSEVVSRKMGEWEERFWHPHKADDKTRHNMIIKAASELTPYLTQEDASPPQIDKLADQSADQASNQDSDQNPKGKAARSKVYRARKTFFSEEATKEQRQKALEVLQNAANEGNDYAQYHLGRAYHKGVFVKQNNGEALKYWQAAMQQENGWAAYALGRLYHDTDFEAADIHKAAHCYEMAYQWDSEMAPYQLGKLYLEGNPYPKDDLKAIEMFEQTEGILKQWAEYKLGKMYENEASPYKDVTLAATHFRNAAELGNEFAQYKLAKAYLQGKGIEASTPQAIALFSRLVQSKNKMAKDAKLDIWSEYYLGKIYLYGLGIERDPAKGLELLEHAAQNDCEPAEKLLQRYKQYRAKSTVQSVQSLIMRIADSLQADTTQTKNYRTTTRTRYERLRQAEKHQDQRTEEMYY